MTIQVQAMKLLVPLDGDYGGAVECSDGDPDYSEDGEAVEIGYWVGEREEDDKIGIRADGEALDGVWTPPFAAIYVAQAIVDAIAWSKSKMGKGEIARLRAGQAERAEENAQQRLAELKKFAMRRS